MRRFSAEYLAATRAGLWSDRTALAPLALGDRDRVLDAGCGTGAFTRILREETAPETEVVGVDADVDLLTRAREQTRVEADDARPVVAGDATRLPVRDRSCDLVTAQALLVNLPDPRAAVREFARVTSESAAVVEPDNASVGVDSTVDGEAALDRRAREAYRAGAETDLAPGDRVRDLFKTAGFAVVATRRHHHEKRVEPPYGDRDWEAARRKASGAALDGVAGPLRRSLGANGFDDLRGAWRAVGRKTASQMRANEYRRVEVVPFDVTVGALTA